PGHLPSSSTSVTAASSPATITNSPEGAASKAPELAGHLGPGTVAGAAGDRLADEHRVVPIGKRGIVGFRRAVPGDRSVDRPVQGLERVRKAFVVPAG